jgi:ribosomal protein S18 acetylase RimI-like enzyme
MTAGLLLSHAQGDPGLRPLDVRRDLADVADLIELCFAATLDANGRAAIAEMRALSRTGPALGILARLVRSFPLMRGFVWVEGGRIVGNVSLAPAGYGRGWIIANVAVAPPFRGQGIARRMMQAALAQVAKSGRFAVLQVDEDNATARHLYETLGFQTQRAFVRWRRPAYLGSPTVTALPPLRRATRGDAERAYALAERARPDARGGLGWLRPTTRRALRPSRFAGVQWLWSGQQVESWAIEQGPRFAGLLRTERRLGRLSTTFDLLVDPSSQGELERPLLLFLLQSAREQRRPFITDHPVDDEAASAVLRELGFWQERAMVHMIRPVQAGD